MPRNHAALMGQPTDKDRQPGDFAAVAMHGPVSRLIEAGQWANGEGFGPFAHALIYIGSGLIVEAAPGGAHIRSRGVQPGDLWSTGWLPLGTTERATIVAAARGYAGNGDPAHAVGYGWTDYAALAAHRLHLWAPGLREKIASTHTMICSQLVDQCWNDAGEHLFEDNRWPGYVTPKSLANRITQAIREKTGPRP